MEGSVLVLGGGIAGMRAAAELGELGLRVHLVEREPDLGGTLARIHRVFPTREHPACALLPWRLQLANDAKVSILTSTELVSLAGSPGHFDVELRSCDPQGTPPRSITLRVGAVIVATGLQEDRGERAHRLGHGRLPDVLTALEFEQQLHGLGPTRGRVQLASGIEPLRVTWIVGEDETARTSWTALTEAVAFLENHADAEALVVDPGAAARGPDAESLRRAAQESKVRHLAVTDVEVEEAAGPGLVLHWQTTDGARALHETDMLVLSMSPRSGDDAGDLAERLGLQLDAQGLPETATAPGHPLRTSRAGVFVCGAAAGCQLLDEAVVQACAVASRAAALLAPAPAVEAGTPAAGGLLPVAADDPPRVGVLLEQGGEEVAGILDLTEIADGARALPGVHRVEVTADVSDGTAIRALLAGGECNRLVVAGPSPITHEPLVQRHAERAGLNRHLVEMVNLHLQCARVHASNPAAATRKARILLRMGVLRASRLQPLEPARIPVTQSCLVLGAGPAGVACTARLASLGRTVHLVAETTDLEAIPGNDHPLVEPALARIRADDHVRLHAPVRVGAARGGAGRFRVELRAPAGVGSVDVGAIVLSSPGVLEQGSGDPAFPASMALEKSEAGSFESTQGILNPLDSTTDGLFLCGTARASGTTVEEVVDGEAAASRAACILAAPERARPPVMSSVVEANCDGCAYCVEPCPTRSITLLEYALGGERKKTVEVSEATCIGCGVCMATCPKQGIVVRHYLPETFTEVVEAALETHAEPGDDEPVIVCFACNRCAYPGADAAGLAGLEYPASVRIVRPVCTGMIHPNLVADTLTRGADGVLVCGCHPGECRSREGIHRAIARAEGIRLLLEDFGLEDERFRLEFVAASEGPKFARIIEAMTAELVALGPSPYR